MDRDRYLSRIGQPGRATADAATLARLHRAHLLAVPFENLDISLGRPLALEPAALFGKIVDRRRGGFCYELNGLFARLLRELGFEVELLAGRVYSGDRLGPPFDHLLLRVSLDKPFIADVGFGDSFIEPLIFAEGVQSQRGADYRLVPVADDWCLERREPDADWNPQYLFSTEPHELSAFEEMCRYHQTSPDSPFTRKSVCSRATPEGRITFSNGKLIVTTSGEREEHHLPDLNAVQEVLADRFGVELPEDAPVERLLAH